RDRNVTGVQTCALPISAICSRSMSPAGASSSGAQPGRCAGAVLVSSSLMPASVLQGVEEVHMLVVGAEEVMHAVVAQGIEIVIRSEERRVGKESRCRKP